MLTEHLERALRGAGIGIFEIAIRKGIDRPELDSLDGLEIASDDRDRVMRELEAFAGKETPELVVEYRASDDGDGRVRWRQARGSLVRDEHGIATHLVGATQDITQLKESQQETRRLQRRIEQAELERAGPAAPRAEEDEARVLERQRQLVTSAEEEARRAVELLKLATGLSGVTVWSIDLAAGDLASANATFINMAESLGYEPGELPADLGSIMELTIFADDRPSLMAALQAYLDGRSERFEAEARVIRKDGSLEWHLARGVAVRDDDGRPTRLTGTSVFVTRIK